MRICFEVIISNADGMPCANISRMVKVDPDLQDLGDISARPGGTKKQLSY